MTHSPWSCLGIDGLLCHTCISYSAATERLLGLYCALTVLLLQIALVVLSEEKTCHIFTEASLAQQLGDQATVCARNVLPDKGICTCQRFWTDLQLHTLTHVGLLGGRRTYTRARAYAQSSWKLKALWLQLQQLAPGLNEKHLCVKVVPWQRFLFCDQGQCEAPFWNKSPLAKRKYKHKLINMWKGPWLAGLSWV